MQNTLAKLLNSYFIFLNLTKHSNLDFSLIQMSSVGRHFQLRQTYSTKCNLLSYFQLLHETTQPLYYIYMFYNNTKLYGKK